MTLNVVSIPVVSSRPNQAMDLRNEAGEQVQEPLQQLDSL